MRFHIENEYNRLEAVLVHKPGPEIDRLTHDNLRRFLFEDVPFLRKMQDEHDSFVGKMRENGIEVIYLENLLREVLEDESIRHDLLDNICETAAIPAIAQDLSSLKHWNLDELIGTQRFRLRPECIKVCVASVIAGRCRHQCQQHGRDPEWCENESFHFRSLPLFGCPSR